MLAGERAHGEQPLLDRFQFVRVEIQPIQTVGHTARGLVELAMARVNALMRGIKCAIGAVRHPVEPAQRAGHRALGALIAERGGGLSDILADLLGALHRPPPRIELRFLARRGRQLLQLDTEWRRKSSSARTASSAARASSSAFCAAARARQPARTCASGASSPP